MKINKFLTVGATVAAMSLSVQAQEAPDNQQEINPTVTKTLNTVGGFLGTLVQGAKTVALTTANGVKVIANSEGAQNIKNGAVKVAHVASNTASDIANTEVGQNVKENAVKGVNFVSNTASDGIKSLNHGYAEVSKNNPNEPTLEAASMTQVSQPATIPSLSQGVEAAKGKIENMIGFLRNKASSPSTTNANDNNNSTPSP